MKGMRKFLFMMALVALVATLATATSWAQVPLNRFEANRTRAGDGTTFLPSVQFPAGVNNDTKVFPAGTVQEPGSMLLYLVDFGARNAAASARPINFISVTNVHPTQAVTVHVRYLGTRNCSDVLDFLMVLTCNDVWMFDPFNINIPDPRGVPTGTIASSVLTASPNYGDGRFLIFISASGEFDVGTGPASSQVITAGGITYTQASSTACPTCNPLGVLQPPFPDAAGRQVANVLFPNAIYTANNSIGGSAPLAGFDCVNDGLGGRSSGSETRVLNILTAKHISFNFLIGSQTIASVSTGGERRSFGISAWARPAVVFDRATTATVSAALASGAGTITLANVNFDRDGDGAQAEFRVILAGQETVPDVGGGTATLTNDNFLRNELQNGVFRPLISGLSVNTGATSSTVALRIQWQVRGGAIAWDRIFQSDEAEITGASPDRQIANFISVEDDYNGSKNSAVLSNDNSASFWFAHTLLSPGIYDNTETPLNQVTPDVIISPPPSVTSTNLLAVICIDVFYSDASFNLGTDVGDLSLRDLFGITPAGSSRTVQQHVGTISPDPPQGGSDLATGWVRFNRLRQELRDTALTNENPSIFITGFGTTPPFNATVDRTAVNPNQNSFVLIARYNIQFGALGAAYWMHGVSDEFAFSPPLQ